MNFIAFTKNTIQSLLESIKKFYLPLGFSTLLFFVMVTMTELNSSKLERFAMLLVLGFLITLCIQLFYESYVHIPNRYKITTYSMAVVILAIFYFFILKDMNQVSVYMYTGTVLALILGLFFAPNLKEPQFVEMYTIKFVSRFFMTGAYSIVLYLGIGAILLTLDKLLNIAINWRNYYYFWLFVVTIFAPIFFLADIPTNRKQLASYSYPSFLRILILYIVMPLSSVYLVILYIYFAKVILSRTWPVGLVSHLVVWFSMICAGVLFVTEPIKDNIWINQFKTYLPKLLLPLQAMMFVSMGIRIKHYGITENRYFILLLGVWIVFVMVYFIFTKKANHTILPLSLALLCIISVFGPLSSYNLSKWSQNNRLKDILRRNGMISNGSIVSNDNIKSEDQKEIYEILYYFESNHSLDQLSYIDAGVKLSDLSKVFGFDYDSSRHDRDHYLTYYSDHMPRSIDIKDFDYLFNIDGGSNGMTASNLSANYHNTDGILDIYMDNKKIYSADLTHYLLELYDEFPEGGTLLDDQMVFDDENELLKVRFIFSDLAGISNDLDVTFRRSNFMLLVKVK